jgi:hypothetical protein
MMVIKMKGKLKRLSKISGKNFQKLSRTMGKEIAKLYLGTKRRLHS